MTLLELMAVILVLISLQFIRIGEQFGYFDRKIITQEQFMRDETSLGCLSVSVSI